jgi:hypothetical protein
MDQAGTKYMFLRSDARMLQAKAGSVHIAVLDFVAVFSDSARWFD